MLETGEGRLGLGLDPGFFLGAGRTMAYSLYSKTMETAVKDAERNEEKKLA